MESNVSMDTRPCLSNKGLAERRVGALLILSSDMQVDGPPCSDPYAFSRGFGVNPTP